MDKYKFCLLLCIFTGINCKWANCETVDNGSEDRADNKTVTEKVCSGTSFGMAHEKDTQQRYNNYKNMYTNCTLVAGNVELVFLLEKDNYDLSFLSSIREITGYLLITNVYADYIPLTSLLIIRGKQLFKTNEGKYYSLYVDHNYNPNRENIGIKELHFNRLSEIMNGDLLFLDNQLLCYENTIDWHDILTKSSQNVEFHLEVPNKLFCFLPPGGECHPDCIFSGYPGDRHCWGAGPEMCQKPSKKLCAPQCPHRCFDELPNQCCHQECAGGCDGPTSKDCWACQNFKNDSVCVAFCPKEKIYENYMYIKNPYARYTYGTICVDECPSHLVVSEGGCVRSCPAGEVADKELHCQPCPNGICPKTCPGTEAYGVADFIGVHNINNFTDCTVIDGSIRILTTTFVGDDYSNISAMHPSKLIALRNVREINGFLMVQGEHEDFTSLSFFESLEVINGREKDNIGASVNIYATTLQSLDLTKLEHIKSKTIFVKDNKDLCYAETVNWRKIVNDDSQEIEVSGNRDSKTCQEENRVCHDQCSDDGCWGAGADHCLECENFIFMGQCVESCDPSKGVFNHSATECRRCNPECAGRCTGEGADQCEKCRNYRDGPNCFSECPENKYPDEANRCTKCNEHCVQGCSGPLNMIGQNGCNSCEKVELDSQFNVTNCLKEEDNCGEGKLKRHYRLLYPVTPNNKMEACAPCHPLCQTCWGDNTRKCIECTYFKQSDQCVQNCSKYYYPFGGQCLECDSRCEQCFGPSNSECLVCKQYKVYSETDPKKFNCSDKCPDWAPFKTTEENENGDLETVCTTEPYDLESKGFVNQKKLAPVIGSVVGIVVMLGLIIIIVTVICQKRAKALESKERLAARMSGLCEESEITPLTPTDAKPDMAKMRIIKESELRKGTMVGSGAFGTVYKGFWIPDGENVKIPVAIKVLQEGTSASQNQELLEEARVMAAVDNKYCVPILGVCMTAQMMLITPYMPLGCLLDYVRKNRDNIGSKVILDWCAQIATGMAYLEERGIVHRDLAARNVLVQNPKRVRVTDFGLSKLLDVNEEEFRAAGGKMPIKWLALECIQHRIFTHKSDVWSFGVAIWELCTYGARPYENIRARDIPELLEKGERLPQPAICTIDVYMIMIKCWMLDAQSRPSFKELAEEFGKMAKDPGRYLFIQGDKLMRLPSHSTETRRDMFRNMSVSTDGPEEIVEAEEYLAPSEGDTSPTYPVYRPRHHRSNGKLERVKEENSGGSSYDNERSSRPQHPMTLDMIIQPPPSPKHHHPHHHHQQSPQNQSSPPQHPPQQQPELKYSGLEAAAAQRKQREAAEPGRDSVKTRYSSDPCKVLSPTFKGTMNEEDLPPAPPTPLGRPHDAQSNENVFFGDGDQASVKYKPQSPQQLPVDEDDYLQPQSAQQLPKYLYVMQDDYLPPSPVAPGDQAPIRSSPQSHPQSDYLGPVIAENPEYFDSPESDNTFNPYDPKNRSQTQPLTAKYSQLPQEASTESDNSPEHDYYNETDLLQQKKNTKSKPAPGGNNRNYSRGAYSGSKPRTESTV